MMIATIEFKNRKTGEVKRLETFVSGYSDAQRLVREYRRVSGAKIKLVSLRSG